MIEDRILIVDDDEDVRNLFFKIFTASGYPVILAKDAEKAIDLIKKDKIRIFFLDLQLPRMNGIDLCKIIRKSIPDAVIHAVTGYSTLFEVAECYEAGFDDYFEKPVATKILLNAANSAAKRIQNNG